MSMATVTPLPAAAPFRMPHAKDEAWRYSDRAALEAAQDLPFAQDPPAEHDLADGARLECKHDAGGRALHHRAALRLRPGAAAVLVQHVSGAGWVNAALDIAVGDGRLDHVIIQDSDADAVATLALDVEIGAGGHYRLFVLHAGSRFARVGLDAALTGTDARLDLTAVQLARGKQVVETVSRTSHRVPHTHSDQIVRSVLDGRATANYLGKIVVERHAQKTDAAQNARALLLDRSATANTKPELEIYADDVKCAHGAAIGALDEDALFYLTSRGIGEAQARAMLIEAFIADVVSQVRDEDARAAIQHIAAAWLDAGGAEGPAS
ncbi:MAG: hypothetical protein Tsb0016_26900 [Sphingomonadales bacterium]